MLIIILFFSFLQQPFGPIVGCTANRIRLRRRNATVDRLMALC